jgi:hypothetical protein
MFEMKKLLTALVMTYDVSADHQIDDMDLRVFSSSWSSPEARSTGTHG